MRKSNRIYQGVGTVAIALSLVACGDTSSEDYGASSLNESSNSSSLTTGGGTSGGSSEGSVIVANTNTINAVALASNVAAKVTFTVDTVGPFFVEVTSSAYSALNSATAQVTGAQNAELDLLYKTNADLASGQYQDSVEVKFCVDSACKNELAGSPYTVASNLTVNVITSTGAEPLLLKKDDRTTFDTDLFAATYVKDAGVFVAAVNSNPDALNNPPKTVIFIDPVTKSEGLVAYLSFPAVSIASDNTGTTPRVVVGHDNGFVTVIEYNKETPAASLNSLLNTGYTLGEVAVNGTDVYAIPAAGGTDAIRRIDLSTNEFAEYTGPEVPAGSSLSAHADGDSVYVGGGNVSGLIQHFDVSGGSIDLVGNSSATGVSDLCGGIWSSVGNDKLISGCGDVFSSSSSPAADMLLLGNISQPAANPLKNDQEVFWFSDSEANTDEMLTLSRDAGCLVVDCPRTLSIYDKTDYSHLTSRTFGGFLAANLEPIRLELPVAAAYSEDGKQIYVLTRLDENFPASFDVENAYLHVIERD